MHTPTQSTSKTKTFVRGGLLFVALSATFIGLAIHGANAAGQGLLKLSTTGGTYTIGDTITIGLSEDSGSDAVNAIEADLTYNPNVLQYVDKSADTSGSTFDGASFVTLPTSGNGVNISLIKYNTALTASQPLATVKFKVIAASPSTTVSYASSSRMVRQSDTQDVWNGVAASANFVTKAAVVTTPPPTTPATGGGSTAATGGTSSTAKSASGGSTTPAKSSSGSTASTGSAGATTTNDPTTPMGTSQLLPENTYLVALYVRDNNNKPVQNASVTLQGKTAKTNADGMAGFISVPVGSYDVEISHNGKTETQKVSVTKPTDSTQNLQKITVKLAAAHGTGSWIIYVIILLVIIGLGAAGFILPRRNKFNGPTDLPPAAPESIVVGDVTSKIGTPTPPSPETVIRPTNTTTNPDEEQKL